MDESPPILSFPVADSDVAQLNDTSEILSSSSGVIRAPFKKKYILSPVSRVTATWCQIKGVSWVVMEKLIVSFSAPTGDLTSIIKSPEGPVHIKLIPVVS